MSFMKLRSLLLLLIALAAAPVFAQSQAFTNRATELKADANDQAATVAKLAENTEIKVVARAGAWTRVEAGTQKGFVRSFHLRYPTTAATDSSGSGGGFLSGLSSALGGRPKTQQAGIQTVGVRGLSPEELKNAAPNNDALAKAQSYRADKPAAERFAKEGKLQSVSVDEGAAR